MLSLREAARLGRQANLKGSYLTAFHFHLSGESERWESCTGDEGATLRYCWRGGLIFIPSLSFLVPLAYPSPGPFLPLRPLRASAALARGWSSSSLCLRSHCPAATCECKSGKLPVARGTTRRAALATPSALPGTSP